MKLLTLPLFLLALCAPGPGLDAQTQPRTQANFANRPYMGWSSWSRYHEKIDATLIKSQADAMIAAKLPAAGYRYINLDDGWSDGFDDSGIPRAKPSAFPAGLADMGSYMHQRGLLFGIYLNPGITEKLYKQNPLIAGTTSHIADITDVSTPGNTRGHTYRIDFTKPAASAYLRSQVRQFETWGVDFIKMDFVGPGGGNLAADNREELHQWHTALGQSSRPIWLELSNYMSFDQAALWRATSNGWRIENDIECYACDKATDARRGNLTEWSKVVERFTDVVRWLPFAGPGGWNDLDTLELGNGDHDGLTKDERQSMFALWTITCAPLYLGSDLTKMDPDDLTLITNTELIKIDQAGVVARPLDLQGLRKKKQLQQVWMTKAPDSTVLTFFNLDETPATIKVSWQEIDALRDTRLASTRPVTWTDLIDKSTVQSTPTGLELTLPAHGSRILKH